MLSPGGPWLDICAMYFLNFPAEIRFEVYAELLVQVIPIQFNRGCVPFGAIQLLRMRYFNGKKIQTLEPAILRTNRQVNREAVTFLYSNNRFVFPSISSFDDTIPSISSFDDIDEVPFIAPFLRQIGANGGLLRHICIEFPSRDEFPYSEEWILHNGYGQNLQLIRQSCTDLRTIEIWTSVLNKFNFEHRILDRAEKMLRTLDDGGPGDMHSLERIIVVNEMYHLNGGALFYCERLKLRMPGCKWSFELRQARPWLY